MNKCEAEIDDDCNGKAEFYVDGVECGYCCGPCSEHSPYEVEWLGEWKERTIIIKKEGSIWNIKDCTCEICEGE